jgi:hypothetical protein
MKFLFKKAANAGANGKLSISAAAALFIFSFAPMTANAYYCSISDGSTCTTAKHQVVAGDEITVVGACDALTDMGIPVGGRVSLHRKDGTEVKGDDFRGSTRFRHTSMGTRTLYGKVRCNKGPGGMSWVVN